jgi:predicted nucleotidyltransferase
MFELARHTVFLTLAGSHAHGTARSTSDVDLRGVCVVPLAVRTSLFHEFEQHDGPVPDTLWAKASPGLTTRLNLPEGSLPRVESVIFDIAKFLKLCASANPNALEILFADERDWLFETPAWRRLHAERTQFLTRKVEQTFLGYAMAQLKRIKTHRAWLLSPPERKPTRADFGLSDAGTLSRDDQNRLEQSLAEKIRSYGIDDIEMPKATRLAVEERLRRFWFDHLRASEEDIDDCVRSTAADALELPPGVMNALNAERRYLSAMKQWESYETWKHERNPARADLERQHGYDTKHAMHLVRLMRMGLEALESGTLRVRRPDAEELVAIRDGGLSYEALIETANELQARMKQAVAKSALPADVNYESVDALALEVIRESG